MKSVRYWILFIGSLLLLSCKDGQPELASLGGDLSSKISDILQTPWNGRVTGGTDAVAGTATVSGTTYSIESRVAVTPQSTSGTATVNGTTYDIRGRVGL